MEGREMEKVCTDSVFGTMTYRHQWYKNETMVLFGKKYDVKVAAQAYSGKDITDEERKGYQYIKEHWTTLQKDIWKALSDYVSENVQDITTYCPEIQKVSTPEEFTNVVTPKVLLCQLDGSVVLLLDCIWDEENGTGVQLYPRIEVADQDSFL